MQKQVYFVNNVFIFSRRQEKMRFPLIFKSGLKQERQEELKMQTFSLKFFP